MTQQTPEQIEADIARQRADLADTVSELQTRLDVKAHAKAATAEIKHRVQDGVTTDEGRPRPAALAGGAAGAAATIAGTIALQRHRDGPSGPVKSALGLLAAGGVGFVLGTTAGSFASQARDNGHGAHVATRPPAVGDPTYQSHDITVP